MTSTSKHARICITGASGTGKTKLANYIADEYSLPFVSSSSGVLWEDYGFKNHADVVRAAWESPTKANWFQQAVAKYRDELWFEKEFMVTDRGPVDQAAYYLNYFQITADVFNKQEFLKRMQDQLHDNFDAIIFIKYNQTTIEDNRKRILDPYFQGIISDIMFKIIDEYMDIKIPIVTLPNWNWEERVEIVKHFLT